MSYSLDEMDSVPVNRNKGPVCDPCREPQRKPYQTGFAETIPGYFSDACHRTSHTFEDCDDLCCDCACHSNPYKTPTKLPPKQESQVVKADPSKAGSTAMCGGGRVGVLSGHKIIMYNDEGVPEKKLWLLDGTILDISDEDWNRKEGESSAI